MGSLDLVGFGQCRDFCEMHEKWVILGLVAIPMGYIISETIKVAVGSIVCS